MWEYSMNTNMSVAHYTLRLERRSFMRVKHSLILDNSLSETLQSRAESICINYGCITCQ